MLGQHPVEVNRESYYCCCLPLHVILPALPASSIISKRIDDATHSDEQRLLELLLQLELSQPPCGQDETDDTDENNQNDINDAPFSTRHTTARAPSSRWREETRMIHGSG